MIHRIRKGVVQSHWLAQQPLRGDVTHQRVLEIMIGVLPLPGFRIALLRRVGGVVQPIPHFAILMIDEVIEPIRGRLGKILAGGYVR